MLMRDLAGITAAPAREQTEDDPYAIVALELAFGKLDEAIQLARSDASGLDDRLRSAAAALADM
jgi:hypothetical protein